MRVQSTTSFVCITIEKLAKQAFEGNLNGRTKKKSLLRQQEQIQQTKQRHIMNCFLAGAQLECMSLLEVQHSVVFPFFSHQRLLMS